LGPIAPKERKDKNFDDLWQDVPKGDFISLAKKIDKNYVVGCVAKGETWHTFQK
jgi:hypothetical protein